jgi:DNA-binding MarR family transcriptional regulator
MLGIINTNPLCVNLFIYLDTHKKCYCFKVSREINITQSQLSKIIKLSIKEKLIYRERESRIKYLFLTDRGKKLVNKIRELQNILNEK